MASLKSLALPVMSAVILVPPAVCLAQGKAGDLRIEPNPGSPIIDVAGGPSGSGIGVARSVRFPLFMGLREAGDVIALDQRGVGESRPNLVCREIWGLPLDAVLTCRDALRAARIPFAR